MTEEDDDYYEPELDDLEDWDEDDLEPWEYVTEEDDEDGEAA